MRLPSRLVITAAMALSHGLLLLAIIQSSPVAQAEVFLWPQPRTINWGSGPAIALSNNFSISAPKHVELEAAVARYQDLVLTERWLPVVIPVRMKEGRPTTAVYILTELLITVEDLYADLQHGVDETYNLRVPDVGGVAKLDAISAWGAIRGLETFSQLVREAVDVNTSLLVIDHGVSIADGPLYAHRGIMLDTSRNFFPVKSILRTIRAMGYNKLNVFHWHITDSQSFPIQLPSEPDLAAKGSYGPRFQYSLQDVADIVQFGRSFGVRVLPEVDMPGHTRAFGGAYPELITCADQDWHGLAAEPTPGQLNPLHPKTYEVVENVINDVTEMFPDSFYHAGADEINSNCWMNSSDIQGYLAEGHTINEALTRFINATNRMISARNKTAVYWEDVLTGEVVPDSTVLNPDSTILQTWLGTANTKLTTSAGYRTIVSSSDCFYLDCGHGQWMANDPDFKQDFNTEDANNTYNYAPDGFAGTAGDWCSPFKTWQRIYACNITANLTAQEAEFVIGAEVVLWSEQADETVLDAKLWPRSASLAESMWSGNHVPGFSAENEDAIYRLNDWRFRMVARGIAAEPLQPLWCLRNPNQCKS